MSLFPGLERREFSNRQNSKQFRYFYRGWEKTDNRPNNSIYYEINDWNCYGKNEIRIDIQFWKEFNEICNIIEEKKDFIGQIMPHQPKSQVYADEKNPSWRRLQFIFSDDTDPEIISHGLEVLIQETNNIINEWMRAKKLRHY